MKYLNQLEYAHIPYHHKVKQEGLTKEEMTSNVRRSGCGLCCVCMTVELLTDKTLDIEECVRISEACVANHAVGTDMSILAPVVAEKFSLSYSTTDSLEEAIKHLQSGGVIIAHVGVPEGAEVGLFTKFGHYICLIATDGKEFCILDPSYTPEKFTIPERVGRVNTDNAPYLYADASAVYAEGRVGRVRYHLFARKKVLCQKQ